METIAPPPEVLERSLAHPPISKPKGPSALDLDGLHCAGLTGDDVRDIPRRFAQTAVRARGRVHGVQIHAAHGFLLSQFLSPLFNRRTDGYGGSIEGRSRLVREAIDAVRAAVGPGFPIGIKLNATDILEGGLIMVDALEVVRMLDGTSVDLVGLARAVVLDPELPATSLIREGGDPPFPQFEHAPPGGITAWYTLRLIVLGAVAALLSWLVLAWLTWDTQQEGAV